MQEAPVDDYLRIPVAAITACVIIRTIVICAVDFIRLDLERQRYFRELK